MKKHFKEKRYPPRSQIDLDAAAMLNRMEQQLINLDRKIDILIGKSTPGPVEARPFPKPFEQPGYIHGHGEGRHGNFRERIMHKAICADCGKGCEVPFKPSGGRPVYCKECFSKRKTGNSFKAVSGDRPTERDPARAMGKDRMHGVHKSKYVEKKRPAVKRRKSKR